MNTGLIAERRVAIETLARNKGRFINVTFTYRSEELSKNFRFVKFSSVGDLLVKDKEELRSINFSSIVKLKVAKTEYKFK